MLFDTAIIGGGPTACGLLTNHALNNEYEDFVHWGVIVFEASNTLGGGSLNKYHEIRSNSHGCAFFDAFTDLNIPSQYKSLNKNEVIRMSELHY